MRKLASVKLISDILPIEGKDRIVLAIIEGWSVIVKKDEFKIGDKCIYIEIDSILPEKPEFEFLRKNGFRIKTMKMAGVISQGICFPISILPEQTQYAVDEDVTELLGIKQYEKTMDKDEGRVSSALHKKYPKFLMRMKWFRKLVLPKKEVKGFPSFISKTDETRIQNAPHILRDKNEWIATEKIDGQSGTFCLVRHKAKYPWQKEKFEYMVCSRNLRLFSKDNSSYWNVSDRYKIKDILKQMISDDDDWVAIQGECIAPNVQGNKYKVIESDLFVFNVITPSGRIGSLAAKKICDYYNLKFVPILSTEYLLPDTIQEILDYAHGQSQIYDTLREGVVFRSKDGRQSFKAVDPLFLLKHDE